jgi:hypothetical protein
MTTLRGVSLAVFVLCVSVSFALVAGLGLTAQAGVGLDPGLSEERERVQDGFQDPESATSDDAGSFVGLATGALKVVDTLRILILHTSAGLQNLGVPRPIADALQLVMDVAFVLAILALMLRFKS